MQILAKNLKLIFQKTIIRKNPNKVIVLRSTNYIKLTLKKIANVNCNAQIEHLEFSVGSYFNFII